MNSAFEIIRQTLREIPGFLEGLDKRAQADRWAAYHSSAQPAARPAAQSIQPVSPMVQPLSPAPMTQPLSANGNQPSAQSAFSSSGAGSFAPAPPQTPPLANSASQTAAGFPPVQPMLSNPAPQPTPFSSPTQMGGVRPLSPAPLPMDYIPQPTQPVDAPTPPRSGSIYRELMQKHDRMSPRHLA